MVVSGILDVTNKAIGNSINRIAVYSGSRIYIRQVRIEFSSGQFTSQETRQKKPGCLFLLLVGNLLNVDDDVVGWQIHVTSQRACEGLKIVSYIQSC